MFIFKSLTAGTLMIAAASAGAFAVPLGWTVVDHKLVRLPAVNPAPAAPVGTVPEPATWAMMVGGFGLVGVVRRRSRSRSLVA